MQKITDRITVALTGVTGAMGGEVLYSLMQSPLNLIVKCVYYDAEAKIPSFVKKTVKKNKKRIYYFKGDIARYEDCVKLVEGADYVINCASLIPPKSDHAPQETYLSNYIGTKNLVDAIIAGGNNCAYVHIATVAMYGHRCYPHVWGRVGDPVISSDYDVYSVNKLKAERYVLESGLNKFVSLRQTGILHKYMFANNLKDGLMFHTVFNGPLEWVTDVDSGILIKNLVERDADGKLDGFWNKIYNIGGGETHRVTGYESFNSAFALMGAGTEKFFKPNWNISRNFHGVWYTDSDELNDFLNFRTEKYEDYWKRMGKKYWYFKLAKLVPASVIKKFVFKRLWKNTNSPEYWLKHGKEGRVKAFFGGRENYEKIPTDWKDYPLLCKGKTVNGNIDYGKLRDVNLAKEQGLLLNHGYDDSKPLEKLTLADLNEAAAFRAGKCLAKDYTAEELHKPALWQCHEGHTFTSTPYTVLKGGYWCPHCCEPKPWRYGALAKDIPFYAQVYFDSHTPDEVDDVYPLADDDEEFIVQ